jgi:hypothetical protein
MKLPRQRRGGIGKYTKILNMNTLAKIPWALAICLVLVDLSIAQLLLGEHRTTKGDFLIDLFWVM